MKSAALKKNSSRAPATARVAPKKTTPHLFAVPTLAKGEFWVGPIFKEDGTLDYHLIGLPGEFEGNHANAGAWAKKQGGDLPNRREGRLLFVNGRLHFNKDRWYWLKEQLASLSGYAYVQIFDVGSQSINDKGSKRLARAVRREPIQLISNG